MGKETKRNQNKGRCGPVPCSALDLLTLTFSGDVQKLSDLITQGADVNQTEEQGLSPLHVAAGQGNCEVVQLLVDAKANINLATTDGKGIYPLFVASEKGHCEVVRLLLSANANINLATTDGKSSLFVA